MKVRTHALPNVLLRREQQRRHWTQAEVAVKIGATYQTVCRWECGCTVPGLSYRQLLVKVFALRPGVLGPAPSSRVIAQECSLQKSLPASPPDLAGGHPAQSILHRMRDETGNPSNAQCDVGLRPRR
jgi:DNA-binding XRE family transcriptional regulator